MFDSLTKRLSSIFSTLNKKGRLSESDVNDMLREVRVALLEADVNYQVAKSFISKIKDKAIGVELHQSLSADQTLVKIIRDELVELLGPQDQRFNWSSSPPTVVLMCGLQGSGKTTTAAKLAFWLKKQGKKPMLVACDTQRPAAITQLERLGEQLDVPVYSQKGESNPVSIAKGAISQAKYLLKDVLIIDTAGRLTVDKPLMDEIQKIHYHTNPSEVLLVLDASTGQEAVNVAKSFHENLSCSGVIFTKLDGDTRAGAVLSVKTSVGLPVRFIGLGEQLTAMDMFYPRRVAERILGMGDILGLIERVEQATETEDTKGLRSRLREGHIDFEDMLSQIRTVQKMGPLKNVLKMIPGLSRAMPEEALSNIDEKKLHSIVAIIYSMTIEERRNPNIINGSRRKRIARGAGSTVEEVNLLLKQLESMRKSMKHLMKMHGKSKKLMHRRK